jgi:hypothetical protein
VVLILLNRVGSRSIRGLSIFLSSASVICFHIVNSCANGIDRRCSMQSRFPAGAGTGAKIAVWASTKLLDSAHTGEVGYQRGLRTAYVLGDFVRQITIGATMIHDQFGALLSVFEYRIEHRVLDDLGNLGAHVFGRLGI